MFLYCSQPGNPSKKKQTNILLLLSPPLSFLKSSHLNHHHFPLKSWARTNKGSSIHTGLAHEEISLGHYGPCRAVPMDKRCNFGLAGQDGPCPWKIQVMALRATPLDACSKFRRDHAHGWKSNRYADSTNYRRSNMLPDIYHATAPSTSYC